MTDLVTIDEVALFQQRVTLTWEELDAVAMHLEERDIWLSWFQKMFALDQEVRELYIRIIDAAHDEEVRTECAGLARRIDRKNQSLLQRWIERRGWPALSVYGEELCECAWMIALHADTQPALIEWVLGLIEPLFASAEVAPVHYASLRDRLALVRGQPQSFGMFYQVEDGNEVLYPSIDAEQVAEKRAALGLGEIRFRR